MNEHYYELRVAVDERYAELVADFIMSDPDIGVEFTDDVLIVRTDKVPNELQTSLEKLKQELPEGIIGDITITTKPNVDWIERYKSSVTPIEAGGFYVRPGWFPPKEGAIDIRIDPALAFGSGHHETTFSCLQAIEKYVEPGDSFLDVGCGSGILSVAAAKLGAEVSLCDTDALAVESATENFALNNVSFTKIWQGSARDTNETYHVVVANIIADVLKMIARDLIERTEIGGTLVLSGILDKKEKRVKEAFKDLHLINRIVKNEWVTLVYTKDSYADKPQSS